MNGTNQDYDVKSVADNEAADARQPHAEASSIPTFRPTENSTDPTVGRPDLTWDISDWFRIS